MGKSIFSLIVALVLSLAAYPQYWQQQVNFTIDVTLNDKEHTLDGFEKITYINNSPDTIHFIWFHLWPNAYKNDKTAFSEQLLINNRTDFYFSNKEQRGYINRLDFKVNGITAQTTDHPQYIDIIQLILPKPLAPGAQAAINTPFHVQLPENFSRGGHTGQAYQVTQWFPKPAVYDKKGWHPIPYLDQGEFYSEFGNYDVRITLPENYVVAATGELQDENEKEWLKKRASFTWEPIINKTIIKKGSYKHVKKTVQLYPASAAKNKTLQFIQNNVHDFAWFADKRFVVNQDTIQSASGKAVTAYSYYLPSKGTPWKNSVTYIKNAIQFRSAVIGEYTYNTVSAVEAKMGFNGGMEYPTITSISPGSSAADLEGVIEHEVGHNWLQGILASNERQYPWMDEGMNTYYDNRYQAGTKNTTAETSKKNFLQKQLPQNIEQIALQSLIAIKKDQPINTPADEFTEINNGMVAYYKTGEWMKLLENYLGKEVFDSCMHEYYRRWQFKHPYPEDFSAIVKEVSGKNTDAIFSLQEKKGDLTPPAKRKIQPAIGLFNMASTEKYNYINIFPAIGYNQYDKFMIGALVHNYNFPANRFRFLAAPLYATGSKKINYVARASYTWFPAKTFYKTELGVSASSFSMDDFQPAGQEKITLGFRKIAPFLRITLKQNNPLSKLKSYIQFTPFFIQEDALRFRTVVNGPDTMDVVDKTSSSRYLNQLKFVIENNRVLYPYRAQLLLEQADGFVRAAFTGNYYFNYANNKSGMNVRLFAGKFFYTGAKTVAKQFQTDRYQLNLTGANGYEDYTYSNYFVGRNEFEGTANRQIMMRDGAFKVRTDLLNSKIGKTDNWLGAVNFVSDIASKKFPIKIFADIGTYADAWQADAQTSRFLYDAGLQLSLLHETINIYLPLLYSPAFKDYFKSTLGGSYLFKTISFSIDIQNFRLGKSIKTWNFKFCMSINSAIQYLTQQQIDKEKWDACIAGSSNKLIYGYSFYLDAMAKHWDALVLNDYEAVMPLTWNKKYGIHYLYQPFCCAMLGVFGQSVHTAITEDFLLHVPQKFRYWDISLNQYNIVSTVFNTYERKNFILSLGVPYSKLYAGFTDNIKRNIKKAEQLKCTINKPSLSDVLALAKLQMQQFAKVTDADFYRFSKLYHWLEEKKAAITYGIVAPNGSLLASCIFFTWQNRAYYILAGNHPNSRSTGASHALINAFIKDHAETNIVLDFEGSDIPGLVLFYSSFGATEEKYVAVKYNRLPFLLKWLKK